MKNNKLKLLAVVFAMTVLYGIIDAMPKHMSQPQKLIPVKLISTKWRGSKP